MLTASPSARLVSTFAPYTAAAFGGFLCAKDRAALLALLGYIFAPVVRAWRAWQADAAERNRVAAYRLAVVSGAGACPSYSSAMPTLCGERDVVPAPTPAPDWLMGERCCVSVALPCSSPVVEQHTTGGDGPFVPLPSVVVEPLSVVEKVAAEPAPVAPVVKAPKAKGTRKAKVEPVAPADPALPALTFSHLSGRVLAGLRRRRWNSLTVTTYCAAVGMAEPASVSDFVALLMAAPGKEEPAPAAPKTARAKAPRVRKAKGKATPVRAAAKGSSRGKRQAS